MHFANAPTARIFPSSIPVECRILADRVKVFVQTQKDAELEIWTAGQHRRALEREYDMPFEIVLQPAATEDAAHA